MTLRVVINKYLKFVSNTKILSWVGVSSSIMDTHILNTTNKYLLSTSSEQVIVLTFNRAHAI